MLCLAYGVGNVLYSGTLSGDVYKWKDNILVENISGAHSVSDLRFFSHLYHPPTTEEILTFVSLLQFIQNFIFFGNPIFFDLC